MSCGGRGQAAAPAHSASSSGPAGREGPLQPRQGHPDPAAPRLPGQAGFQDLVTPGQMCPSEDRLTSAWDPPFTGAFRVRPLDEAPAWLAAENQGSVCG